MYILVVRFISKIPYLKKEIFANTKFDWHLFYSINYFYFKTYIQNGYKTYISHEYFTAHEALNRDRSFQKVFP